MSAAAWKTVDEKPHGFRVTIERAGRIGPERHTFPSKTQRRNAAVQAASYKKNFLRLLSVDPLTREEWEREFGKAVAK